MRVMRALRESGTVTDDRGASVPLVERRAIREGLTDFQRRELRTHATEAPARAVGVSAILLSGWLLVRYVVNAVAGWRVFDVSSPMLALPALAFWIALTWLLVSVGRRRGAARVMRRCLRWGICASCAHPLRGLPVQEDGCVVCSECGAAWKRERM